MSAETRALAHARRALASLNGPPCSLLEHPSGFPGSEGLQVGADQTDQLGGALDGEPEGVVEDGALAVDAGSDRALHVPPAARRPAQATAHRPQPLPEAHR